MVMYQIVIVRLVMSYKDFILCLAYIILFFNGIEI